MSEKKVYYWIKLKRDFFKRHDIRIVESMPNGKDYILFYLKLLCESVDHNGNLRFSETIPYDEKMLSVITDTNIDIVRSATKVFSELNMISVLDNGTYFMNEVQKMIGSETNWAEQKRNQRMLQSNNDVTPSGQCPPSFHQEKDKELDKDIELEKELKENTNSSYDGLLKERTLSKFVKPSLDEITNYCDERHNSVDPIRFYNFYESKGWMIGKNKMKDWKAAVRTWENGAKKDSSFDENEFFNANINAQKSRA